MTRMDYVNTTIDMDEVVMIYENPGIYDGWSIARLSDGTLVNRWPVGDYRHTAAQRYLDAIQAEDEKYLNSIATEEANNIGEDTD